MLNWSLWKKNWPRLSFDLAFHVYGIINHRIHCSLFYIYKYIFTKFEFKKKTIDWWYIFNRKWLLKKNITEELQLKNIFSIDKNAGLGILKDTGKTLITNYMYNVPVIEIVFFVLIMICSTKLFSFKSINSHSLKYLYGLWFFFKLAFVLNLQHATHFRVHVQSRNTSNFVTDTPLLNKIRSSKEKNDSIFFVYCEVRFI